MKVSVITPSRLAINPVSEKGRLFLDRSLASARRAQATAGVDMEIIVGADPGSMPLPERFDDVSLAIAPRPGQAAAVNMAASVATGDVIAILEDDDLWDVNKLGLQLPLLEQGYHLVTCNQREVDEQGNFLGYNDFPTPSGWIMTRETWEGMGGFNENLLWHVDNEWLGRAKRAGLKRGHLINDGYTGGAWLAAVAKVSDILKTTDITEPLVTRVEHEGSGMSRIKIDGSREQAQSEFEMRQMVEAFGEVPW